mmetsp:Transcript_9122/g.19895  ORF Transcript_9122/g.19895 Transcript_9122/m.19895 type:complete len:201 (-) Transcript_9122:137-739(-)
MTAQVGAFDRQGKHRPLLHRLQIFALLSNADEEQWQIHVFIQSAQQLFHAGQLRGALRNVVHPVVNMQGKTTIVWRPKPSLHLQCNSNAAVSWNKRQTHFVLVPLQKGSNLVLSLLAILLHLVYFRLRHLLGNVLSAGRIQLNLFDFSATSCHLLLQIVQVCLLPIRHSVHLHHLVHPMLDLGVQLLENQLLFLTRSKKL